MGSHFKTFLRSLPVLTGLLFTELNSVRDYCLSFLADRTNSRAYATVLRLSLSSVCLYEIYCG